MTLRIARRWATRKSTIGQLYVDGLYQSDCLEDRLRRDPDPSTAVNEGKVYGETAIPAGRYQVVIAKMQRQVWLPEKREWSPWSPRPDGQLPQLLDIPGFMGIFVHAANSPVEILGCIATGTRDLATPDRLTGSRVALTALVTRIEEGLRAGEVWIDIENFCEIPEDEGA